MKFLPVIIDRNSQTEHHLYFGYHCLFGVWYNLALEKSSSVTDDDQHLNNYLHQGGYVIGVLFVSLQNRLLTDFDEIFRKYRQLKWNR